MSDAVTALYRRLLSSWNNRDAEAFGSAFETNGSMVGFDGSAIEHADAITEHLGGIFKDHTPATYVGIVREVRAVGTDAALLRAVAGMIPPGADDIKPELNTIHLLVAVASEDAWRVAHFQSTPARFDGRPDDAAALTEDLRAELQRG
jgi:uncharacterized protein (TIGR02246 family)